MPHGSKKLSHTNLDQSTTDDIRVEDKSADIVISVKLKPSQKPNAIKPNAIKN